MRDINKTSASGTSGITYQLMFHLPLAFIEVILALYRPIFLTGLVPHDWKFLTIFPIFKLDKFEYNMANVRPIALLEIGKFSQSALVRNSLTFTGSQYALQRKLLWTER